MTLKMMAALLAAALPLMASAQSAVTVYGQLDAALAHEDADAPGVASRTALHAGQASSRIGFRGTEDLGGGMKALFNVEAGYGIDTGMGDSALFGRRAVVGLEGNFGQVTIGREYTPIDNISGATHILGQGFYGTNLNAFANGRMTRRISNSVNYKSKPMAGLKFSAAVGLGETPAGPSQDLKTVSVEYQQGKLFAGIGYATYDRLASGNDREMIFGAAYAVGALEFKGNYMVGDQTGPNNRYTQANLGAAMTFGAGKLYGNLQQSKLQNGARGNGYAVSYAYSLSKRTNVYASYGTTVNNERAAFSLSAAGSTITPPASALGADPVAYAAGVRHTF
ncbi:porin [Massilia soli]|uniref:Porin n=1 Tax=Massilia soli TaxID=2792854 RepID=A0ABS7SUI6_9BURK|nr:porin [Massilia soli]MBZ2209601.1 porin [Massilia soli]